MTGCDDWNELLPPGATESLHRMNRHHVKFIQTALPTSIDWNGPAWAGCVPLTVDQFHSRSSDHRPVTQVKLLATGEAMHLIFRVMDRFILSRATHYQEMVCRDSCVEFFWQPVEGKGYFNFEFNCGGTMLLYYLRGSNRKPDGSMSDFIEVDAVHGNQIEIITTMPRTVPVEIVDPMEWRLAARIPYRALEAYVGPITVGIGGKSRANFFKCGSECSHPHWASWSNIGETLDFHQLARFGELEYA